MGDENETSPLHQAHPLCPAFWESAQEIFRTMTSTSLEIESREAGAVPGEPTDFCAALDLEDTPTPRCMCAPRAR